LSHGCLFGFSPLGEPRTSWRLIYTFLRNVIWKENLNFDLD